MWKKLSCVLNRNFKLQKRGLFCVQFGCRQQVVFQNSRIITINSKKWLNELFNRKFSNYFKSSKLKLQPHKTPSITSFCSDKNKLTTRFLRIEKMSNFSENTKTESVKYSSESLLTSNKKKTQNINSLELDNFNPEAFKKNLYQRPVTGVTVKLSRRKTNVKVNNSVRKLSTNVNHNVSNKSAISVGTNIRLSNSTRKFSTSVNNSVVSDKPAVSDRANVNSGNSTSVERGFTDKSAVSDRCHTIPKNVLHNTFDVVAQRLNNRDLRLQPTYNMIKVKSKVSWGCTYNIKWPEPMKFVSVGQTKQEASHKAALSALDWLKKNEKITKDGYPILIEKSEMLDITKRSIPTLTLDSDTTNYLKDITNIYSNEFLPLLQQSIENQTKQTLEVNEINSLSDINGNMNQKVFGVSRYLAKEKVILPISEYKEQFMNLLKENQIIIVKGEPGCGKSTRIPQYVLEAWAKEGLDKGEPCRIAVTQPRRIAAISLADRVSDERDERCGHIVGYQIRLKSNFNPTTGRILYCTTGILLKHLQSDINLSNFTHVILDEAHERDVNTDLLLNLLRTAIKTNPNLKLIVMSATVDINLFKNYLNDAPTMHIPGFTYPVKYHFLDDINLDMNKTRKMSESNEAPNVVHEEVVKMINHIHNTKDEGAILCFLPGWEDIVKVEKLIPCKSDRTVLCLHSRLQDSDQRKIFSRTPPGVRKIILSTNIAETSVTIDDVVYVVDTGIHKENRFDNEKGVICIDNYWISQSSMAQRKGRAGRVQPGESFHLYPKSKFDSFSAFTDPEILKTSLTKIVLNSKVYSNNMDALEFMSQLPTPPDKNTTRRAVRELKDLQLLDENENLTSLGKVLANFQLEPKLAKVLVNAVVYKCVTPVVDIVTIFSSNTELFSTGLVDKDTVKQIKTKGSRHSDHLAMMRLFEAWLELMEDYDTNAAERYCYDAKLIHHKLITLNKLRKIHFDYLHNGLHNTLPIADNNSDNDELVKAILFSGAGTLLRHRSLDVVNGRYKSNVFLTSYNQKATITSESVNFKKTSFPSQFLVYFNEIRSNIRRTSLIRESSVIAPIAVLLFSNKPLITKEDGTNKMTLSLKDTKVEIQCSKEDAEHIIKCKEAIDSAYSYFIFQMTEGGECNSQVNAIWDKILKYINLILQKHSIK